MEYIKIRENRNPIVSATKLNGKQDIKVFDSQIWNMRTLEVEKEKVDTFIKDRDEKLNKLNGTIIKMYAAATIGLGVIGHLLKVCTKKGHGAFTWAGWGFVGSAIIGYLARSTADYEITQKFIDENK